MDNNSRGLPLSSIVPGFPHANIDAFWGPYDSAESAMVYPVPSGQGLADGIIPVSARVPGLKFGVRVMNGSQLVRVEEYQVTGVQTYKKLILTEDDINLPQDIAEVFVCHNDAQGYDDLNAAVQAGKIILWEGNVVNVLHNSTQGVYRLSYVGGDGLVHCYNVFSSSPSAATKENIPLARADEYLYYGSGTTFVELNSWVSSHKPVKVNGYVANVVQDSQTQYTLKYVDGEGVLHIITHDSSNTKTTTTKDLSESVHIDADDTSKVFAIKDNKGTTIGSITLGTNATNGAAELTFVAGSDSFVATLPNLAYDSSNQMLKMVEANGTQTNLIKLSNLQIKGVGSTLPCWDTTATPDPVSREATGATGAPHWAIGDLFLLENSSTTPSTFDLCVCTNVADDGTYYNYSWQPLGSINNVSLQADQVSFTPNGGLSSTTVQGAIEEVKSLIGSVSIEGIYPDFSNTLYVVDANGYVGLKLDANGLDVAEISSHLTSLIEDIAGSGGGGDTPVVVDSTNWMYGKNIYSIGDSLCAGGVWQTALANIVGANFDSATNALITEGGKTTIAEGGNQDNALVLKGLQDNGAKVDILFIENGNDSGYGKLSLGTISDVPFFKKQTINSLESYSSAEAAWTACQNGGGAIFDGTPMVGTRGRIQYSGGAIDSWFVSKDVNDWNDGSKWVRTVTTYAFIKGMLEYVCENFKNTKVFYLIPQWIEFPFGNVPSNFKYADGSINIAAWLTAKNRGGTSAYNYEGLVSVIKACCAVYSIPVIDLSSEAGLNLFNAYPTYYAAHNTGNVHPNNAGYVRWGETIARLLTGK